MPNAVFLWDYAYRHVLFILSGEMPPSSPKIELIWSCDLNDSASEVPIHCFSFHTIRVNSYSGIFLVTGLLMLSVCHRDGEVAILKPTFDPASLRRLKLSTLHQLEMLPTY